MRRHIGIVAILTLALAAPAFAGWLDQELPPGYGAATVGEALNLIIALAEADGSPPALRARDEAVEALTITPTDPGEAAELVGEALLAAQAGNWGLVHMIICEIDHDI